MRRRTQFLLFLLLFVTTSVNAKDAATILDAFDDPTPWHVIASTQVSGSIRPVKTDDGSALCLDYDFNGVSGYVGIQRDLQIDYPDNYRFDFKLRGESPDNDLQFKLIDASGDNVWWVNRPKYTYPSDWMPVRYKRRHISKAWGPAADPVLRSSAKIELTINNSAGGKGAVCFDTLTFTQLPEDSEEPNITAVSATSAMREARLVADGDNNTAWHGDRGVQRLTLDLGRDTEFGGLQLDWGNGLHASEYPVQISDDGSEWHERHVVKAGNGGRDWVALPESEARYVAIELRRGPGRDGYALNEVQVEPLAFAATTNHFVSAIAKETPRGLFPRGFSGEQAYWTILGIDGGTEQGLIGEDGAIEVAKSGFSVEPFVITNGKLLAWADAAISQSLQDGYLPIPSVEWTHADAQLRVTAFADGTSQHSQLIARYVLRNTSEVARDYTLALAVRPFQVNPPSQFLNMTGGVSPIERLAIKGGIVSVDGRTRVYAGTVPDATFATLFDAGMAVSHLADAVWPTEDAVDDPTGLASGVMGYRLRLQPGESREVALRIPLAGPLDAMPFCEDKPCTAAQRQDIVADRWRHTLDAVRIDTPPEGQPLVDTLRTALAHQLISRIGPRLQPGTRAYARSWIRDGAMISEGLLRMGREDAVRDYLDWYAPYQFDNGKVPCCVDDRGSDPVPENDSHGELIFAIADYARHTGDDAFLTRMWPHVQGAFEYMEVLSASERTEANRALANHALDRAFYGMMPASISHEGYSAKPMHSYWDNYWALRGYKDAAWIAERLGKHEDAARMMAARDRFRDDLDASLRAATSIHGIDYLPGAAELGDFDPTSTTIALAPGGEQSRLPQQLLRNTFERYWREFAQRRDGAREWKDYTPYEWRNVGAFVRLGWRERAWDAVKFFFDDRAPRGWNQWGEVVSRTPRTPFFLGDLPHAWVASDFMRSALDMFAYQRESEDSLVIAAGIPARWLDGKGIAITGLHTPDGRLGYALHREPQRLVLHFDEDTRLPPGGAVLPWPLSDALPGKTMIDGKPGRWHHGELHMGTSARQIVIELR